MAAKLRYAGTYPGCKCGPPREPCKSMQWPPRSGIDPWEAVDRAQMNYPCTECRHAYSCHLRMLTYRLGGPDDPVAIAAAKPVPKQWRIGPDGGFVEAEA